MIKISDLEREIKIYQGYLDKITAELEELRKKVPEDAVLRAVRHGNKYQYFQRTRGGDKNGIYLSADKRRRAEILAQIEYDKNMQKILNMNILHLMKIRDNLVDNPSQKAKEKMSLGKREIIHSPFIEDDEYIEKWKNLTYEKKGFSEDYPEYYSRQGLRVRSKSEVIIAYILDDIGIPFHYEKPLAMASGFVHPDFSLLNIKNRKEVYWEHFGMMDDIEYRVNAFNRIRQYEANGYYQFESVIWTFESGKNPINTKAIRKMVCNLKEILGY